MYTEPTGDYKRRHGLDFPADLLDVQIDLLCWKHFAEPEYKAGNITNPHELFISAIRSKVGGVQVLTPDELSLSEWTVDLIYHYTHEENLVVWGAASSGKSWTGGLLALMDWYVDPLATITLLASTSKEALLKRTFASVVHYHRLFRYKGLLFPGVETPSRVSITMSDAAGESSMKTGIFGIAVKEGPVAEAVGRIRGCHSEYVRFWADEMGQMPAAVWDPRLRYNMRVGTKSCKCIGLTNIDSLDDLAGRNSEPIGGWGTVNIDTKTWKTRAGRVLRFDGFKSPAILEPDGEKKYPYLLNKKMLEGMIAEEGGNEQAPGIMTMVRSWPPDVNARPVIVSATETVKWGMRATAGAVPPRWSRPPTVVAGLDGSAGGDTIALQFILVGIDDQGKWTLWFEPEEAVPVKAGTGALPVLEQVANYCMPRFGIMGLQPRNFAADDSAAQGVCDYFARIWSPALLRFNFGARAGELPVSAFNPAPARERYADTATELGFLFREYGQYGQIKNVGPKALKQLTSRETIHRGGRLALLDKRTYKKNTGQKSPDEMDAGGMALGVVRYIIGLAPGATDIAPMGPIEAYVNPDVEVDPAVVAAYNNLRSDYPDGR